MLADVLTAISHLISYQAATFNVGYCLPEESMKNFGKKVQRFLASEDGPTAVEYAVMLALIVIVCLATITTVGQNANLKFEEIAAELAK